MTEDRNNEKSRDYPVRFIYAPDQRYECIQCAQCCSDFYEITVDEESVERIKGYDLSKIRPSLTYATAFKKSPYDAERTIISRIEGRCCFLVKQHLCGLQFYFGEEAKPKVCRQFPIIFVRTPDGIYVSGSFVCYSILHNEGAPLRDLEPNILEIYENAAAVTTIPPEIKLNNKITLTWENYKKVETGLLELLSIETIPLTTLLIAGNVYLDLLSDFVKEAQRTSNYTQEQIIDSYLEIMRKQKFGKPIEIAQRRINSPLLQKLYLGMLISFRNTMNRKRGRFRIITYLFKQYLVNILGLGSYQMLPVAGKFYSHDFHRVRLNLEEPFFRYSILRYISQLIFRKEGLDKMSFQKSYRCILLYFALIRWYVVGLTAGIDPPNVDRATILEAISLVERYYVRHSSMDTFFTSYPYLDVLLDNFMSNKRYASSIVLPPVRE